MPLGRRCDTGCESWPDDDRYKRCPICGGVTSRHNNLSPLDEDDARERAFEAFYADYCERRGQAVEGGLPMSPEDSLFWDGRYPGGAAPSRTASRS